MSDPAGPPTEHGDRSTRRAHSVVVVNTGPGKGKSSAAFGMMLRARARDWPVAVIQFLKSGKWHTGEEKMGHQLGVDWWTIGEGFTWESNDIDIDREVARRAWARAREVIAADTHRLVILDEVTYPINWGWIDVDEVVAAIRLLEPGVRDLEARTGVPILGVLPHLGRALPDAEDSLDLPDAEPDVAVRFVRSARILGTPDLVVLPGSRATVADLDWVRARRLDAAIAATGAPVLGVCAGYQMLGREIEDRVESRCGRIPGLGWLESTTCFEPDKLVRWRTGRALHEPVTGFDMRHGRIRAEPHEGWVSLDDEHGRETEGSIASGGHIGATGLHGLLEHDRFRGALLADIAARAGIERRPSAVRVADVRRAHHDRLADLIAAHVDVERLTSLIATGACR